VLPASPEYSGRDGSIAGTSLELLLLIFFLKGKKRTRVMTGSNSNNVRDWIIRIELLSPNMVWIWRAFNDLYLNIKHCINIMGEIYKITNLVNLKNAFKYLTVIGPRIYHNPKMGLRYSLIPFKYPEREGINGIYTYHSQFKQ
jgi:hypothetical protein